MKARADQCECPELRELFQLRVKTEGLESKCDVLRGSVDLESFGSRVPDEREVFRAMVYGEEAEKFSESLTEYGRQIGLLLKSKKLVIYGDSIHCSSCDYHVDDLADDESSQQTTWN